ncbi:MAG: NAD(+)/NADH kinase [Candidatus Omnitrophica bacterium]|nr:NAD(+)/NADH kinase [Candidatus Omnitrophota bacterium]
MIKKIFILENKKIEGIEIEKEKIENLLKSCGKIVEKEYKNPDLILAMGGDGTILKAINLLKNNKTLIYGIKYGKVGFLTNPSGNIEEKILRIINGKFKISERILIELIVKREEKNIFKNRALNDFLIQRKGIRIIDIKVEIDKERIFDFRGDGIIISTPTGSTAYSLSVGGPIIHPDIECFLLTPFSPYTLSIRPIVIPSDEKIKIRVSPESKIICDGQKEFDVTRQDIIEIKKSKLTAKLIIEDNFFSKLQKKFNFGK